MAATDADITLVTLGIHASTDFTLGTIKVQGKATLGWQHAFGGTPHTGMTFESGDAFDVAGVPLATDVGVAKASLDLNLSGAAALNLAYTGRLAPATISQTASATFDVKF